MTRQLLLGFVLLFSFAANALSADRPNFVWMLSEDNSKHYLKLFDERGTATPEIQKLAEHGILYERAFSNAPVCSVARTTLMTSVYAPRIGTQFHRKIEAVTLPKDWKLFSGYLREAGYYTTNNSKEDYNTTKQPNAWDDSSRKATWKNRPNAQTPFFHMQSYPISHESSLHFTRKQMNQTKLETDPKSVQLAPYHPDTPLFRYTHARYLDRMKRVDEIVGKMVADLAEEDLLEDTFIFYFGDHGGVLPRSKGYLYETGLHVPLVVRVPDKWKHLVKFPLGSRVQGFVSFVDFGPTLLHLAGITVPTHMDGKPILGPDVTLEQLNQRDETFGYADRFDEKYDFCRSLRKGRYKYLRNYQPYYPDALHNNYRYIQLAYEEWRSLYREGKLDPIQSQFFLPKDSECLYDIEADPYETKNLAGDPQYQTVLKKLRGELTDWVKSLPDLSFFPETLLVEQAVSHPLIFGKEHKNQIARLVDIANLSLEKWADAEPKLKSALQASDPWERYWAAIVCGSFGTKALPLAENVKPLLEDKELLVRIRAAEFLGSIKAADPRPTLDKVLKESQSPVTTLIALNAIVYLRDDCGYKFDLKPQSIRGKTASSNADWTICWANYKPFSFLSDES